MIAAVESAISDSVYLASEINGLKSFTAGNKACTYIGDNVICKVDVRKVNVILK